MHKNIEAGYSLTCKMVVYEENSSVYVGMVKPTALIGMLENSGLFHIAAEVESELTTAIDDVTTL